ncbi:MAG: ATP-dependent helicase HrpB [Halieaceae bacterium]|nr:ATP-dependent helicase HrpB [Halieaceae bacterium]
METDLPISDVLMQISAAFEENLDAVLEAPPGAGKTTIVPLHLLTAPWLEYRKILVLEPRRLAARTAATRMAQLLGEDVGETIGYRIRQGTKVSANTHIEVITEGILTRMLQEDPALPGVAMVIFDEFHERHLHTDVGLALLLQARELFRDPDDPLRILVMSATLEGVPVDKLLNAPVVRSQGRQHPVEVYYGAPRKPGASIIGPVVDTIQRVLADPRSGSVLVFLPGEREIRVVEFALPDMPGVTVRPLAGSQALYNQQQAIEPAPLGDRKVVLSTNVAESSLTIDGIKVVIDCGLERAPQYDPVTGMSRLYTRRISKASSVQRAGRAGRMGPGKCYRLWSEAQQRELVQQAPPEILQADLSQTALQLLAWGIDDVNSLDWLDKPPAGAWAQALELLQGFDAITAGSGGAWVVTRTGEQMARLPVHPRVAHMMIRGCKWGLREEVCALAAIMSERDPFPDFGADIERRLAIVQDKEDCPTGQHHWKVRAQRQMTYFKVMCRGLPTGRENVANVGALIAEAYPDRIARRRGESGHIYQLANGRAAALDPSDPLCNEEWLAVAELGGQIGAAQDRVWLAAPLNKGLFMGLLSDCIETADRVEWDDRNERFVAERQRRIGALVLAREPLKDIPSRAHQQALLELMWARGLNVLPWTDDLVQWRARVNLLHREIGDPWPDMSNEALMGNLEDWLLPYLGTVKKLADFQKLDLRSILTAMIPWPLPKEMESLVPEKLEVPSGSQVRVDYTQDPPLLAVKLQEMFGCIETPKILGIPVLIHLLSPAGRPLQVTQDLTSFWRNSYFEVRKEMQGRYPKHPWPENPLKANPTGRTRRHA